MAAKAKGLLAPKPVTRSTGKKRSSSRRSSPVDPYSNPAGIAGRQSQANQEAAQRQFLLNNPTTESNQYGSQNTTLNADGTVSKSTTLSPEMQKLWDLQNARESQAGEFANSKFGDVSKAYSSPYDLSGLGNDPSKMDFSADRSRIEGEIYNRYKQDLDTQFAQQNQDFERSMSARGIPMGSEQYNRAQQKMAQDQARAYQDARTQALQTSGDEMTRSFGMAMDSRQRAVDEYNMGRDRPYSELANVLGTMKGPQDPQFQARAGTQVNPVDETALGTAQMGINQQGVQNKFTAGQNALDRATQLRAASMSKGGGSDFNPAAYRQQGQIDNELYAQRLQIQNQYAQKPKQPNALVQAGGQIISGLARGAGAALGKRI